MLANVVGGGYGRSTISELEKDCQSLSRGKAAESMKAR